MSVLPVASSAEVTQHESVARGRSLYVNGIHADGQGLIARYPGSELPLPQAFVACVNCHGFEARGGREAGVDASDIRWATLSKPYDLTRADGSRRAPYDSAAFFRALTKGRDPSGQELDSAMPRFTLSSADADDLRIYLQYLANPGDQGVSDEVLTIGIMTASDPAGQETTNADQALLGCWFDQFNTKGGIFRRRIQVVSVNSDSNTRVPPLLAVLAINPTEQELNSETLTGVPILMGMGEALVTDHRYRFAIYPALASRARTLARFGLAQEISDQPKLALLYSPAATSTGLVDAVIKALEPLATVKVVAIEAANAEQAISMLKRDNIERVLMLGAGPAFETLISNALQLHWDPLLLWIERPDLDMKGLRALTLEPALDKDVTAEALDRYARCVNIAATSLRERRQQLALLASARLLVTALEQGGREMGRERLIETLQSLREFQSGFAPPGSLTPQRHTTASGLYVVPLPTSGLQLEPVWTMVD